MKKEIPILMSTPMVQAILEGRKTKTRRVINPQPQFNELTMLGNKLMRKGGVIQQWCETGILNRYGNIGDLLYVRESWRPIGWDMEDGVTTIQYADKSSKTIVLYPDNLDRDSDFHMKLVDTMEKKCEPTVNEDEETFGWSTEQIDKHMPWKPSIHMPKSASRIWTEIASVRVEKLQNINEVDSIAEGIEIIQNDIRGILYRDYLQKNIGFINPIDSFKSLWQSINNDPEKPHLHWEANPWVWVIEFKIVEK